MPLNASIERVLVTLASHYLAPWNEGIAEAAVDDAHTAWADYRDPQWGGAVPLGESHNRLLRINVHRGQLYYVGCVGSRSKRRLRRQVAALNLLQAVLDARPGLIPDLDLVLSLSDRPTVPKKAVPAGQPPPPVFAYVRTRWHYSVPFPYLSFEPSAWGELHRRIGTYLPLGERRPDALWRGSCNSLCDMMRRKCQLPEDATLMARPVLLHAAARCPEITDVGITAAHRHCTGAAPRARVPIGEHARHAMLLHVDGNGFSGRLEELLTLGAAVLRQESPFSAYYYPLLERGVHYEPLDANLSDLCERVAHLARGLPRGRRRLPPTPAMARVATARMASARAAALAANAEAFARQYLSPPAVVTYVTALLRHYAALQRFRPRRHPNARPWRTGAHGAGGSSHAWRSEGLQHGAGGHGGAWRSKGLQQPPAGGTHYRAGRFSSAGFSCDSAQCCQRHPRACAAGRQRGSTAG